MENGKGVPDRSRMARRPTWFISALTSKILNIVNLYLGTADEAKEEGGSECRLAAANPVSTRLLTATVLSEEGFQRLRCARFPALGEEFDPWALLIGKKGTWYDHKVRVENPVSGEAEDAEAASSETENSDDTADAQKPAGQTADVADGTYTCEVTLQGGSGRASVEPASTSI